jgi:hypothetical protein
MSWYLSLPPAQAQVRRDQPDLGQARRASWFGLFATERLPPGIPGIARAGGGRRPWLAPQSATAELSRRAQARIELMELLALGPAFQFRLAGPGRRLRASLPVSWLASVWACGLAVIGGHLVVGVDQPGWPRASVRALPAPGATPSPVDVVATGEGPAGLPRWEIAGDTRR